MRRIIKSAAFRKPQEWILMLLMTLCFSAHSQEVLIQSDCVQLRDLLGESYPSVAVQCGFMPGDSKSVPSGSVASFLKRNTLAVPQMPEAFTVTRAGTKLGSDAIRTELETLYKTRHPEKTIEVDNIRIGREIYILPDASYELVADTDRFGSGYASLVSGDIKVNFSYTVKVYEQGYIVATGLRTGDELAGAVTQEMIDVTNLRTPLVKDISDLIAARSATRGKVLTADLVQHRPERIKGDKIILVYKQNTIRLELECIAEGNAVVGKTFPVRNPSSGKVLTAIYTGDGRAEVN